MFLKLLFCYFFFPINKLFIVVKPASLPPTLMSDRALSLNVLLAPTQVLSQLHTGQLLKVNGAKGSVLIVCHRHHAEVAGPGSAVGGLLDIDCHRAIPVGRISLTAPQSPSEKRDAFLTRQQWISSTQQVSNDPVPLRRAVTILKMLERYCGQKATAQLSEDVVAQLVGVLPRTMLMARKIVSEKKVSAKAVESASVDCLSGS